MMPLNLIRLCAFITISISTTLTTCIVTAEPLRLKQLAYSFCILFINPILNMAILPLNSPFRFFFALIGLLLVYKFIYHFTGRKIFLTAFIALAIEFSADLLTGATFIRLFDSETIEAMRYVTTPGSILLQAVCGGCMVIMALMYRLILVLLQNKKINPHIGYLLRPIFLIVIICMVYFNAFRHISHSDEKQRFLQLLPDFIVVMLLLVIGITYVLQDIRSYRQTQENKTLLHQQSLQSLLLQDTRIFRHNISNMIYGFQGMLLSGNIDEVDAYYKNMVASCQLINNENVVSLQRLPSVAVSTLLLHKIQDANEHKIPFHANVQENIDWFGLKDNEMVQILGVLLDNALEAARESTAPMIYFDARNNENALSITVCNTCAPGNMPHFTENAGSTKEGHEGLGLKSVHTLIGRHSHVLFNIYTRGRYVEANLMIYK